ncbi:MAG: hypothetical protein ABI972_17190 [Acidobacteriota bacterium]
MSRRLTAIDDLQRGHLRYFPVAHGRMEFAIEVRRAILIERPAVVAIELPSTLEKQFRVALRRLPQMSVLVYPAREDESSAIYVPVEPCDPFVEAIRTAEEIGAKIEFIAPDFGEPPHLNDAYPDPYAIRRIPLDRYIEAYRLHPQDRTEEVTNYATGVAWKLQGTDTSLPTMVVLTLNLLDPVLDAMEVPQDPPKTKTTGLQVDLINPSPSCLAEITMEYPYLQERYERYRLVQIEHELIDRPRAQIALLRDAEEAYKKNTGDQIQHWQRRMIARYTRNLASLNSELTASLFDITVAARAIVDDNYAWEVWEMAGLYPAQREASSLETVDLSAEEVWLRTRKIRLRRRLPRPKQKLKPANLKMRRKERKPGEWAEQLDGSSICSYPPEDLVIEDFGHYLKKKAQTILSEERERVEPFTTSILDGIDIRETIRNWHDGTIFVRNAQKIAGDVGAVVVIFDQDPEGRYHYMTTWLGEHQNESDMAFYATNPFDHIVGPGIGRAEYGGFLMTRPPRRMFNVWDDRDYDFAESKPERLLMAALDYSIEKYVVYVAAKPPRSVFRSIASHLGRRILYVPIGQMDSTKVKRLRVVHVLDGHDKRDIAKDFIW